MITNKPEILRKAVTGNFKLEKNNHLKEKYGRTSSPGQTEAVNYFTNPTCERFKTFFYMSSSLPLTIKIIPFRMLVIKDIS